MNFYFCRYYAIPNPWIYQSRWQWLGIRWKVDYTEFNLSPSTFEIHLSSNLSSINLIFEYIYIYMCVPNDNRKVFYVQINAFVAYKPIDTNEQRLNKDIHWKSYTKIVRTFDSHQRVGLCGRQCRLSLLCYCVYLLKCMPQAKESLIVRVS